MEKEKFFNFDAFRKALYDGKLSERARLVYIHLLQKSSNKGCPIDALYNDVELTEPFIAIDLGILTKKGDPSTKLIQRALAELQENGYITKFQKYRAAGCPLTIRLNFSKQFLFQKKNDFSKIEDKKESDFSKTESGFVQHYNPLLSFPNPSLSSFNPSQSLNNPSDVNKEDIELVTQSTESTNDYFNDFKEKVDTELVGNEDELLQKKVELSTELGKKRIAVGNTVYNRCSSYLRKKYEESLAIA